MGKGGGGSTVEHKLQQTERDVSRYEQILLHACLQIQTVVKVTVMAMDAIITVKVYWTCTACISNTLPDIGQRLEL
jgi:hypothetical protein